MIPIKVLKEGKGTPVNPHSHLLYNSNGGDLRNYHDCFAKAYPELPSFYNDGTTPLPVGYEGGCEFSYRVGSRHPYNVSRVDFIVVSKETFDVTPNDNYWWIKEEIYLSPDAPESKEVNRDWDEDKSHENGNYVCACGKCGFHFIGHKRRVRCKLCATTTPAKVDIEQAAEARFKEFNSIVGIEVSDRDLYTSGFIAGANHIKATHVPVEEVEKILESQEEGFKKSQRIFLECAPHQCNPFDALISNNKSLLSKIRQLIKTT